MISTELQAIELGSLHASLVTLPVLPANYVSFQRLLTDSEISVDGSDIVDRNVRKSVCEFHFNLCVLAPVCFTFDLITTTQIMQSILVY